ncbi:MAG: YqgE/AlgH family protein [Bacteroidetes bacterium]|nr:YqgE/AlgH family protein [Bacteroidota bacterium]
MLNLNFHSKLNPKPGTLLIAEPFTDDEYFRRSVVFLCNHDEEGTLGFVLNNYLEIDFNDLSAEKLDITTRVSIGGPVDTNNIYYLHRYGNKIEDSIKITEEYWLAGNYHQLIELLKKEKEPEKFARFFLGYSGWTKNQLEEEIKNKFWIVMDLSPDFQLMDTFVDDLWKDSLSQLGGRFEMFKHFPLNPNNN